MEWWWFIAFWAIWGTYEIIVSLEEIEKKHHNKADDCPQIPDLDRERQERLYEILRRY